MVASRDDEDDSSDDAVVLKPKSSGGIAVARYDDVPKPTPRPALPLPSVVADAGGQNIAQVASHARVAAFFATAFADSDDIVPEPDHAALEAKVAELDAEPAQPAAPRLPPVAIRQPVTQRVAFAAPVVRPMQLRDVDFELGRR